MMEDNERKLCRKIINAFHDLPDSDRSSALAEYLNMVVKSVSLEKLRTFLKAIEEIDPNLTVYDLVEVCKNTILGQIALREIASVGYVNSELAPQWR
jgi:DNA phosphorothioation-dependent restriction protein DptG